MTLPSDPTTPGLSELIERVERAEGPDREIDAQIVAYLNHAIVKPYPPTDDFGPRNRWQFWSRDGEHFLGNEGRMQVARYTESLDAIVGLIERELPGEWSISVDARIPGWFAWIENDQHVATHAEGVGATKALAVCAACLRALSTRGGK